MGRTLGRYFADEIAGPLGLDFHIGLPNGVDRDRVAHLHVPSMARTLLHINKVPLRLATAMFIPSSLTVRAGACFEGHAGLATFNREDVRVVEIPAANGIGTARSVAKLYGDAATGGSAIGLTPAVFEALTAPAVPPALGLRDRVLHVNTSFSLGFARPVPQYVIGSSDKAFGAPGAGGSVGFADPDTGIGFGYVMNKLGFHLINDPRALRLRQALFRDVLGARPQS
jgi:CubicO group peptidase (beta-lactamase class C family)